MSAVLLAGIGLLILGAVVLIKFPDRLGGKIGWHGMEVSSAGAGLPLIVLGLVCVVTANTGIPLKLGWWGTESLAGTAPSPWTSLEGCFKQYFLAIPNDRVAKVAEGTQDLQIIGPHQAVVGPIGLAFTDGGQPVGAIRFQFISESELFKVEEIVDRQCKETRDYANGSRGGDPRTLQNWDTLEMRFEGKSYNLRLGYDTGAVEVNSFTRVAQ